MTRLFVTCEAFDVAVVPFPFTDSPDAKRRPALVLSDTAFNRSSGHTVMAQITSAVSTSWPGDVPINHMHAGLTTVSLVRMKLFTIDNRLIRRNAGKLSAADRDRVSASLRSILDPLTPVRRHAP